MGGGEWGDGKAKTTLQREGAPNPEIKIKLPPPNYDNLLAGRPAREQRAVLVT